MTAFRNNLRGIIAMLASCLFFILNDTMVKIVGDALPLGQIITLRGVVSTVIILAVALSLDELRHVSRCFTVAVGLRTFGEVSATLLFLSALMHLPLANISAVMQATPLALTAAAAIFLRHKVGWRRWTAVVVGFAGILIIVRPGADGFNLWALVALCAVALVVLRDLATRAIPTTTPTVSITLITSVAVMLSGVALSTAETWQPVGWREGLLLLGAGTALLLGIGCVITAMRAGDVAIVAPFRYSFIPYSVLLGWFVWGDVPDGVTFIGIAIVILTGVYTFYRERKVAATQAQFTAVAGPPASGVVPVRASIGEER
jgi:drug/metabolite transporter (DMT)-like permease